MISVIAAIEVADGQRDAFLAIFNEMVPKVRAEEGCIEYGPWLDLPTNIDRQEPARENVVTVIEKWESVDALEAHLIISHMLEFRKAVEDLVTGITLQILQPA